MTKALIVLFALIITIVSTKSNAQTTSSGLSLCFSGVTAQKMTYNQKEFKDYIIEQQYQLYEAGQISCENTRDLRRTLKNISDGTGIIAIAVGFAAPTGLGLGVSAILGVTSLGINRLEFEVGMINCEEGKAVIGDKLKESVCEVLSSGESSVDCNPSLIKLLNIENIDLYCKSQEGNSI